MEVDAFACRIGRQQNPNLRVVLEAFFGLLTLFAAEAAVDRYDRFFASKERCDAPSQIIQRVTMLGEDHELL